MSIDRPIAIALIIVITVLLIFFFVLPEYNKFSQLRQSLAEKLGEYDAQHDYYAAIDKIALDLQDKKAELTKIDNALPQDASLGSLMYYLQKTAKSSGLITKSLFLSKAAASTAKTESTNTVKEIIFSMDATGDYPSLQSFISTLEKSARIFEVNRISFSSSAGPPFNFNLQIKTQSY